MRATLVAGAVALLAAGVSVGPTMGQTVSGTALFAPPNMDADFPVPLQPFSGPGTLTSIDWSLVGVFNAEVYADSLFPLGVSLPAQITGTAMLEMDIGPIGYGFFQQNVTLVLGGNYNDVYLMEPITFTTSGVASVSDYDSSLFEDSPYFEGYPELLLDDGNAGWSPITAQVTATLTYNTPEPTSTVLIGSGLLGLMAVRRRSRPSRGSARPPYPAVDARNRLFLSGAG